MLKNSKIENAIPGYTGYKPKNAKKEIQSEKNFKRQNYIPGYQGHIPKIESENLYGKTFGQITYDILNSYQDHYDQFMSSNKEDFLNIKDITVKPVQGVRCLQNTLQLHTNFKEKLKGISSEQNCKKQNSNNSNEFIKDTISGYQGHIPGVYAENIYGKTYKEAQELAQQAINENLKLKQEIFLENTQKLPNIR